MTFALGQRWISDTEHDLGLGTLVALDARTITLLFAASQEQRVYARQNAPITRVVFAAGDIVDAQEGWSLRVEQVVEEQGMLIYLGVREDTNESGVILRETFLAHQIRFNKPQDKLFAGQISRNRHFVLRYQSLIHQHRQHQSPLRGLRGVRAGLIAHQLYIAHEVGRRHAPRVLLADEVGLGKTIEAGMIIHQQYLSSKAERVLIVVPETLQHQWLVEMLRRFNLSFSIFDQERCIEAGLEVDNPFESQQLVLCSLDFLRQHPTHFEQALAAHWDLLVVDEAHHLQWSQTHVSEGYQRIEQLAQRIAGVLLLTATPEQLGRESHFARLRLLDPDRFYDYDAFLEEEAQYAPIAQAVTELLSEQALTPEAKQRITGYLSAEYASPLLADLAPEQAVEVQVKARQTLIDNLMDRHGTGRVLFRNTRASIQGFPQRLVHLVPLSIPTQYETAMRVAQMLHTQSEPLVRATQLLYPEAIYQELEGDQSRWWQFDPRVDWLIEKAKQKRGEKWLVIAAKASTALQLEQALREREGLRATVFHEGMSILERDKAAAYFAQEEGGAQILICSEIGSEGRNFQFAHQLVMFDLPLNPDLLEQRIGRLDRIGQTKDIDIHVPYFIGSAQEKLALWYHQGLQAFSSTCPTGRLLYEQVMDELILLLIQGDDNQLNALIAHSAQHNQELKQALEQGRDKLLEMHSHGGEQAAALVKRIAEGDGDSELVSFAFSLFDCIGLNQDDRGDNALVISPSEHMLVSHFPGLNEEGTTITFDRSTALAREDIHFISWEHPIILAGMDLIASEQIGMASVALLKNKALPVGTFFLELIYVMEAQAPKKSGINAFLPPTPIRLLLDAKGRDLAAQVKFDDFDRQLSPINRQLAGKLAHSLHQEIGVAIAQAETLVQAQVNTLRAEAQHRMQDYLSQEAQRLSALQALNPSIRTEEIEAIEQQIVQLTCFISQAQYQLDSVRLIVVAHQ